MKGDAKRILVILIDKLAVSPIFWLMTLGSKKKKSRSIKKNEVKNILIIRPGGIGDYLLNVPAFKKIRKTFPSAKITLFIFKRNKISLSIYDEFDKKIEIDKPLNFFKFIFSKKNYDLVFDFNQHRKMSSLITLASRAKYRIGFDNNGKAKAYNFPIKYSEKEYEGQSFYSLLSPLKIKKKLSASDLVIESKNKNTRKIKGKNPIGIYACAMKLSNRLKIKEWEKIIKKEGKENTFYFIGSKEDSPRYDKLNSKLKGYDIVRMDGKLSIQDSFNVVSKMKKFISEDGGAYHFAICAGTPSISYWLHGKDNMKKWKGPGAKHKGILLR